jgi:hypothetical protein
MTRTSSGRTWGSEVRNELFYTKKIIIPRELITREWVLYGFKEPSEHMSRITTGGVCPLREQKSPRAQNEDKQ